MSLLVIFSQADGSQMQWLTLGGSSVPLSGPFDGLPSKPSKGSRVVWLVRSEQVLLLERALRAPSRAALAQAIPFALEEDLAQDVEVCHFVFTREKDRTHIAVLDQKVLRQGYQILSQAGVAPRLILPDCLALPSEDSVWSILPVGERVLLRTGQFAGFACEKALFPMLLSKLYDQAEAKPEKLKIFGELPETVTLDVGQEVQKVDHPLAFLAGSAPAVHPLNLLAAVKIATQFARKDRNYLLLAAGFCLAAAFVLIGDLWLKNQALVEDNQALRAEQSKVLKKAFPEIQRVVNPRLQMQQRAEGLTQAGDQKQEAFFDLLHQLKGEIKPRPGLEVKSLDYRSGSLALVVELPGLQDLDKFKAALQKASKREVTIASVDKGEKRVKARLNIAAEAG